MVVEVCPPLPHVAAAELTLAMGSLSGVASCHGRVAPVGEGGASIWRRVGEGGEDVGREGGGEGAEREEEKSVPGGVFIEFNGIF